MEMNSTDLSPEDQQMLSDLADKSQDKALREAVNSYLERRGQTANGSPSVGPDADEVDLVAEYRELFPGYEPGRQRVSRDRIREILSKIPESLSAELVADRADRL